MLLWDYNFIRKKQVVAVFWAVWLCVFSAVDVCAVNALENKPRKTAPGAEPRLESFAGSAADFPVYLYFADNTNQYLLAEERLGLGSDEPVVFCRQIIDALIQGPLSGLVRTIPAETELQAIFIDDKTAYVDLTREVASTHPGGIQSELLTIYSIVNTLVLNVDGVDQVKILIAGQEAETLSGHIDIRFPLSADMLLIR